MAAKSTMRIAGKILKYLAVCVVFAVMIFMIWRAFFSDVIPNSINTLTANDALYEAYKKDGNELLIEHQKIDNITRVQLTEKEELQQGRKSNYGYFCIPRVDIIPAANQVQIVFRYNNSTIRALKDDYGVDPLPDRSAELYDVSLVLNTDLTPDNQNDNANGGPESVRSTRYFPSKVYTVSDEKNMYNYRKYVFENISLDELSLALFVDIYYIDDIDYEKLSYGTVCIWEYKAPTYTRKLSPADIAALDNWRKEE